MSKAGQRIFASLIFSILAGFFAKPAFAQIPLSSVSNNLQPAYVCSYQTMSCNKVPANFISQAIPTPTLLPRIKVVITKPSPSIETQTLSQLKLEAEKIPAAQTVEKEDEEKETETKIPQQTFLESIPNGTTLDSEKIQGLINEHRKEIGLSTFEKDENTCAIARARSAEIAGELSNGVLHSGLYNRNLPYWIWENAKVGSNEQGTVTWWLNSPIHRSSIEGNYKYSCGACTGTYCSQIFTSYEPKVTTMAHVKDTK